MKQNHDYFEFLCALASSDELTEAELIELHQHSLECVFCRERIFEMGQVNARLILAHAFNRPSGRLPQGMRERFIARAIEHGVPLTSPSPVGSGTLGLASVCFIILLVTAAAVKGGLPSRSVVDTSPFDAARMSASLQTTRVISPAPANYLRQSKRDRSRGLKPKAMPIQKHFDQLSDHLIREPQESLPAHLDIFQNRDFPARLPSEYSALVTMPPSAGRLSSSPDMGSRFRAPPALIRGAALQLLANSEHGALDPMIFQSGFTFVTTAVPGLHPAVGLGPSRVSPAFELRGTPPKFHFVEGVTQ